MLTLVSSHDGNNNRSGNECGQLLGTMGHLNDDYDCVTGIMQIHTFMVVLMALYLVQFIEYLDEKRSHEMQYGVFEVSVLLMNGILASLLIDWNYFAIFQLQILLPFTLQFQLIIVLLQLQLVLQFKLQFIKIAKLSNGKIFDIFGILFIDNCQSLIDVAGFDAVEYQIFQYKTEYQLYECIRCDIYCKTYFILVNKMFIIFTASATHLIYKSRLSHQCEPSWFRQDSQYPCTKKVY